MQSTFDRHAVAASIGITVFIVLVTVVPNLAAERFEGVQFGVRSVPLGADDVEKVDEKLKVPGVRALGSHRLHAALDQAEADAAAEYEDEALERARRAVVDGRLVEAHRLAVAVVEHTDARLKSARDEVGDADGPEPLTDEVAALQTINGRARLLLGNVHMQKGQPAEAIDVLTVLSDTPVDDYALYMRAESHRSLGQHERAAKLFRTVAAMDTVLVHRARVRRAHSLYAAGDWEAARRALKTVVEDYDEYPRRHRALFEFATTLEKLGQKQEAANQYQQTWFEYPYHVLGRKAHERMERLEKQDAVVPSDMLSGRTLYRRYRRLRINKHWDTARRLFLELQQDYATEDGHSGFEHDIEFQLALNAYHSRAFEDARRRFEYLAKSYEEGHRKGIGKYLLYKYLSRTLARLGDVEGAVAAIDGMTRGYGERSRLRARAEFWEDHGEYEKAYEIYDELYYAGKKRRWHFTWISYRTGRLDQAYENLTRLAERSSGRRNAKYMYWAGRTLERGGKLDEARKIFADVHANHEMTYYGLQSANRIIDIDQRRAVDGQVVANAEGVANSADSVLDALEEAEDQLAELSIQDDPDPRARPRAPDVEVPRAERFDSGALCEVESATDQAYCDLQSGNLPDEARPVFRAAFSPASTDGAVMSAGMDTDTDDDEDEIAEVDRRDDETALPDGGIDLVEAPDSAPAYTTDARIYWNGRVGSATSFARWRDGEVIGPKPRKPRAYDEPGYRGGLERAAEEAGELFPEVERAWWLHSAGMVKPARWSARDFAIEYRELTRRWRPSGEPHELPTLRWEYYIDNRRHGRDGFWGVDSDERRFPVPGGDEAKQALLERQREIYAKRRDLRPIILDALKEAGDHFMVRKYTLGTGGWYRRDPAGTARTSWMQAYPRAFPRLVLENAERNGVNPYLLWALMTVESSYNPDSLSYADALGLLQVIPRTGLKTAIMLGDEDFGPQDLLEPDIAIEHGAFYFSKLVHKFRGQELLAFAGYNGGPHRVGDWLDMRGDGATLDEFVEEIPFDQARRYAKKVYRFVALYLRIYEGVDTLYVGQNLRPDYRPHPKF